MVLCRWCLPRVDECCLGPDGSVLDILVVTAGKVGIGRGNIAADFDTARRERFRRFGSQYASRPEAARAESKNGCTQSASEINFQKNDTY